MTAILTKAGGYIAIILLGWVLRKTGFFKENDYKIIMKVVLNITLPASIIYSYAGKVIDFSLLAIAFLGLLLGFLHMGVGYICAVSGEKTDRAFSLLNISGYNIGNFTLPFAQGLLGAEGVIATSLFGIGNSFICLGMACSFASMIRNGTHFSWKTILKDLVRSIPFDAYFIMAILALAHVQLPGALIEVAGTVGSANTFLAMLMLGVCFHISGDRENVGTLIRLLAANYVLALAAAFACFFLLPLELEYRKALVMLVFSPITSNAVAYTEKMRGNVGLASAINSISAVISLTIIVCLFLFVF